MPERLATLLSRVTDPEGPPFYRTLYGMPPDASALSLAAKEDWQALPFLGKELLLKTPIKERAFVPWAQLDSFYASSGTTGSLPLFGPRACLSAPAYRSAFHDFQRPCLSSIILPHMTEYSLKEEGGSGRVIALDPKRMRASVALARAAGVDSVLIHSFLMPLLCRELTAAGLGPHIRYVEIAGEPCSQAQYDAMRRDLPNATITPVYGAREVEGPIGLPCRPLGGDPLEVYHPNPEYYLELINENGEVQEPVVGFEAELVVTAFGDGPFAFPLLRYRIGDVVRVEDTACPRHGIWSFSVIGRAAADFIKVPGGMLRADEIARVLSMLEAPEPEEFQAEFQEKAGAPAAVVLRCRVPDGAAPQAFASRVAALLRIGPAYTYADGVRDGHYLPLALAPLPAQETQKRRRLIRSAV